MPSGTGIKSFNQDLATSPPSGGHGIIVGANLYQQLTSRITLADYHPTGMPSYLWKLPTLDSKYPITLVADIGLDDYKF